MYSSIPACVKMNNNNNQELIHSFSIDVNSRSTLSDPVIVREIRRLTDIDILTREKAIANYYKFNDEEVMRSPRGNKQLYWIFTCIYRAYIDQGVYITPKRVAAICGLDNSLIEKALNTVPIAIDIEPIQLMQYYLNEMHVQGLIDDSSVYFARIEPIYNRMYRSLLGREVILDSPARNIAIGIISYFMENIVTDKRIDKEKMEQIYESSTSCITRYRTKIQRVYNLI